jgi:hypothetical protein
MKFLRIHLCIFSMILACVNIGNCGDLPQTNEALRARYETKNNGLTQEDIAYFLFEAIRLNDREMVKTIKNPPLQKRTIGNKTNPTPSNKSIEEVLKAILDRSGDLSGIDGYLEVFGINEVTQEVVNGSFSEFTRENNTGMCKLLLQQDIKPDQETMNAAFIKFAEKGNSEMCRLLMEQDIKPDQDTVDKMNKAFFQKCSISNLQREEEKHDEIDEACIRALNHTEHAEQNEIDEVLIKSIENKNDRAVKIIIEKYQPSIAKINKGLKKAASYENSIGRDLARMNGTVLQGQAQRRLDEKIARAEKDRKSANKICTILINNKVTPPSDDSLKKAEEAGCGRKISATRNASAG